MYVDKVNTKTTSQTWSAKIGSTTDTTGTVQSLIRRSSPSVAETSELFLCLLVSASFHTVLSRSLTLYHSVHSFLTEFRLPCVLLLHIKNVQKRIFFECASFFSGINYDWSLCIQSWRFCLFIPFSDAIIKICLWTLKTFTHKRQA